MLGALVLGLAFILLPQLVATLPILEPGTSVILFVPFTRKTRNILSGRTSPRNNCAEQIYVAPNLVAVYEFHVAGLPATHSTRVWGGARGSVTMSILRGIISCSLFGVLFGLASHANATFYTQAPAVGRCVSNATTGGPSGTCHGINSNGNICVAVGGTSTGDQSEYWENDFQVNNADFGNSFKGQFNISVDQGSSTQCLGYADGYVVSRNNDGSLYGYVIWTRYNTGVFQTQSAIWLPGDGTLSTVVYLLARRTNGGDCSGITTCLKGVEVYYQ